MLLFESTLANPRRIIHSYTLAIASKSRSENKKKRIHSSFLRLRSPRSLAVLPNLSLLLHVALLRESLHAGARAKIGQMCSRMCVRAIHLARIKSRKPRKAAARRTTEKRDNGRTGNRRRLRAALNCGSRAENTI